MYQSFTRRVRYLRPFLYLSDFLLGVYLYDVEHLIEEGKPGTDLHQAINEGLELVIDRLPDGGDFNIWPMVTMSFFWRLNFSIDIEVRCHVASLY